MPVLTLAPAPSSRCYTMPDHPGRACAACRHYRIQHQAPWCIHPIHVLPVPWQQAIAPGAYCAGDNAPLWEARTC